MAILAHGRGIESEAFIDQGFPVGTQFPSGTLEVFVFFFLVGGVTSNQPPMESHRAKFSHGKPLGQSLVDAQVERCISP